MNDREINICLKNFKNSGRNKWFEKLYNHFLSKIYRFILLKVFDRQISEDLTSEVFVKAYKNLNKATLYAKTFKVWLYKIAGNVVIDYFRKIKKIKNNISYEEYISSEGFSELDNIAGFKSNSFDNNTTGFKDEEIVKALNKLPDNQREIINLRYIEGLDYRTIGSILGKRESAVRAIKFRALMKLREFF